MGSTDRGSSGSEASGQPPHVALQEPDASSAFTSSLSGSPAYPSPQQAKQLQYEQQQQQQYQQRMMDQAQQQQRLEDILREEEGEEELLFDA